ncbi:hypothetical protein GCM10027406_20380 [Leifsonia lichenia]
MRRRSYRSALRVTRAAAVAAAVLLLPVTGVAIADSASAEPAHGIVEEPTPVETETEPGAEVGVTGTWDINTFAQPPAPLFAALVAVIAPAAGEVIETRTPVFSGTGEPGLLVQIEVKATATIVGKARVDEDGRWAVASNVRLADGLHELVARQLHHDYYDHSSADLTFTVVAAPNEPAPDERDQFDFSVESPMTGSVITDVTTVFRGHSQAGYRIELEDKATKRTLAAAYADADGRWLIEIRLEVGFHEVRVVQMPAWDWPTVGDGYVLSFTVDSAQSRPLTVTTPDIATAFPTRTPTFSGTGTPGSTIEIRGPLTRTSFIEPTVVDSDGNWAATSALTLPIGGYIAEVRASDASSPAIQIRFWVGQPPRMECPAYGETVEGPRPTYSGTAFAGAMVEIRGNSGKLVASATADANGVWSTAADFDLVPGHYIVKIAQSVGGVDMGRGFWDVHYYVA